MSRKRVREQAIVPSQPKRFKPQYFVDLADSLELAPPSRIPRTRSPSEKFAKELLQTLGSAVITVGGSKAKQGIELVADYLGNLTQSVLTPTKIPVVKPDSRIVVSKPPSTRQPQPPQPSPLNFVSSVLSKLGNSSTIPSSSKTVSTNIINMPRNGSSFTSSKVGKQAMRVVTQPAAKSLQIRKRGAPVMSGFSSNLLVKHSEMIAPVISSTSTLTYRTNSYVINAGNCGTFPWLSSFSSNFDQYRIHKINFTFVSNQPTSTAGRVGLGIDYDSTDLPPGDRNEFYSLTHHVETPPWESVSFSPPVDKSVRFINSHTSTDSKLIDCGQLVVMSDQIVATSSNLGDIIVEYVVELIKPQQAIYSTTAFTGKNVAPSLFSVSGPVIAKLSASTSASVTFTFNPGYYAVVFSTYDSGGGNPYINYVTNSGGITGGISGSYSATVGSLCSAIKVTVTGASIVYSANIDFANMEKVLISISRICVPVYNDMLSNSVSTF